MSLASRFDPQRERACESKVRFADEYVARIRAQELLAAGKLDRQLMFVYACPFCHGWHFTKRTQGSAPGVTRDDMFKAIAA